MKVFVIVTKMGVCHGHGDYGDVMALRGKDPYNDTSNFCPCFTNREKLNAYAVENEIDFFTVVELEVVE